VTRSDPQRPKRTKVKPLHVLFLLALGSPLLALLPTTQDPAATDWPKEVERACTAQRYGLRLAAAKKVAAAGAAAVPAIAAYAQRVGRNEVPATLVEALADADTSDAAVVELLRDWATDREFYWRPGALRGLARRGPLLREGAPALRALFASLHGDPAWLVRAHARYGSALLGDGGAAAQAESDPRAVRKLAALLLQSGQLPPLQPLFDAFADDRTFLGDPWGQRTARDASLALRAWLGSELSMPAGETFAERRPGIEALLAAARTKSGQELRLPVPIADRGAAPAGGIEVLSCRNGDLFVTWTAGGELRLGLDGARTVRLPGPVWEGLSRDRAALELPANLGTVVCDSLRLRWAPPELHARVAPGSLPPAGTKWLSDLAKALQDADQPDAAGALRAAVEQFGPR